MGPHISRFPPFYLIWGCDMIYIDLNLFDVFFLFWLYDHLHIIGWWWGCVHGLFSLSLGGGWSLLCSARMPVCHRTTASVSLVFQWAAAREFGHCSGCFSQCLFPFHWRTFHTIIQQCKSSWPMENPLSTYSLMGFSHFKCLFNSWISQHVDSPMIHHSEIFQERPKKWSP